MNTEKRKKNDAPTASNTEKTFVKTGEPINNYDSTDQKKPKEEPLAPKAPEVSKNIPVNKGSEG